MSIDQMLKRFSPVYAADGVAGVEGAPADGAAATVEAIVNDRESGAEGDDEMPEIDTGLQEGDGTDTEYDDFDYDGLKLKVPKGKQKEIEEALLRQADYTKKTQEAAKVREEAETRAKTAEDRVRWSTDFNKGVFHLEMIDSDLKKEQSFFQSPEYQKLQAEDFIEAQARWNRFQMNKDTRVQLATALQRMHDERNSQTAAEAKAQAETQAKQREQLPREIAKIVPGWNADRAAKVTDFAVGLGFDPDAVKSTTDPLHFKVLHLAEIGQKYLDAVARKGSGAVIPKQAGTTNRVGQRGGAVNGNGLPSDKMSIDQWMEAERKREIAARKAR